MTDVAFEGWVNGHPPCDAAVDRAALLVMAKAYDLTILDEASRAYVQRIVADIDALQAEPHPDQILALWKPLFEALNEMGLRHTGAHYDRMRDLVSGLPREGEVYERAHLRFDTVHGPKAEEEISRLYAEGIDPATGKDLEPGWLHLYIPGEFPWMEEGLKALDERDRAGLRS